MAERVLVRVLSGADVLAYREVRLAALRSDPDAFLTSAEEFVARSLDDIAARLRPSGQAVTFGAVLDGDLVGLLTLARESAAILAHRVNIYGVSVAPQARRQGVGDALMRRAVEHAAAWEGITSLHLAVMDTQVAAQRLYERHDFTAWGRQPDAVRRGGRVLAEVWMWRAVPGGAGESPTHGHPLTG